LAAALTGESISAAAAAACAGRKRPAGRADTVVVVVAAAVAVAVAVALTALGSAGAVVGMCLVILVVCRYQELESAGQLQCLG
jgi:hypothetical protein